MTTPLKSHVYNAHVLFILCIHNIGVRLFLTIISELYRTGLFVYAVGGGDEKKRNNQVETRYWTASGVT